MKEEKDLIELLEKELDNALLPIDLEKNYIERINAKLLKHPRISVEWNNLYKIILLTCFSFFMGLTILIVLNRIFMRKKHREIV